MEVRPYVAADESAVVALLESAFGGWPHHGGQVVDPAEFLRWKMDECPFGPSLSLVATEGESVIGYAGQLRWRLTVLGRQLLASRGVDLAVHQAYRGRGVATALVRRAGELEPRDIELVWNDPNERSRPLLMKNPRRRALFLPRFVQPPGAIARTALRIAGSRGLRPVRRSVEAASADAVLADTGYVLRVLRGLEEPRERVVTARDLAFLRWRYGRFGGYHAVRATPDARTPGVAIFRVVRRRQVPVIEVSELLVAGNDHSVKRGLLRSVRRAVPTAVPAIAFPSRAEAMRSGAPISVGGTEITMRLGSAVAADPTRGRAWALSLGDVRLL